MSQFRRPHIGCDVDGCPRSHYGRGFCRLHWERDYKNGNPLIVKTLQGSTIRQRIEAYSKRVGECLIWTGYKDSDGYGHITVDGRDRQVHRVAWELDNGLIPSGLLIRHTCDTPPCIEPNHLITGTEKDNSQDMVIRSRSLAREKNHQAKMTELQVSEMRSLYVKGHPVRELALIFEISVSQTRRIVNGENWK